jgi:hypothetical protein
MFRTSLCAPGHERSSRPLPRAPATGVVYSIAACAGRAEIPIIAMGGSDAVGEHDLSEIGF